MPKSSAKKIEGLAADRAAVKKGKASTAQKDRVKRRNACSNNLQNNRIKEQARMILEDELEEAKRDLAIVKTANVQLKYQQEQLYTALLERDKKIYTQRNLIKFALEKNPTLPQQLRSSLPTADRSKLCEKVSMEGLLIEFENKTKK